MSNQSLRQASIRAITGTTGTLEEDWLALFDQDGIQAGTFNERLYAWLEGETGLTGRTIDELMNAYAVSQGVDNWNSLGTLDLNDNVVTAIPQGNLTLVGRTPAISVTASGGITIPTGDLFLSGFAPTLSLSGNFLVAVPQGNLLLSSVAPTLVQSDHRIISPGQGNLTLTGHAPNQPAATITLTAEPAVDTANAASYTFSAASVGTASSDRIVHVVVHWGANLAVPTDMTLTIDGNAMASQIQQFGSSGNLRAGCAIFSLAWPTGTTAEFIAAMGGQTLTRCAIEVYASTGIPSATASDTGSATNATALTDTIIIPAGGVAIGGSTGFVSTTMTWTNITEASDRVGETNTTISSACDVYPSGGSTALTATFASAPSYAGGVFATWSP